MTPSFVIRQVEQAREQGVSIAIEMPREGFWVMPEDKLEVLGDCIYWEHSGGRTFIIPANMVYLRFAEKGP